MSPQAWEEHYQKNKNNFCKEADPLLIAEISLLGKKLSPHFSSILDFGCGFGANSLFLAEQGWQVTAIDLSKTAIEKLQEQAKQNRLPLTAQQADAVCFSSKEKFDLVLICDLHLPTKHRKKMLQNVVQLLKKKGMLLCFSLIEPTNLDSDVFPCLEKLLLDFPKELKILQTEKLTRSVFLGQQESLKGEGIKIKFTVLSKSKFFIFNVLFFFG